MQLVVVLIQYILLLITMMEKKFILFFDFASSVSASLQSFPNNDVSYSSVNNQIPNLVSFDRSLLLSFFSTICIVRKRKPTLWNSHNV